MLEIKNVTKKYTDIRKKYNDAALGYKPAEALKDVSFSIGRGEIIGLFGENGAGKTTLMKSILGLVKFKGDILLDGEKITRKNASKLSFATCEHSFFPDIDANAHREFYKAEFDNFREKRFDALMDFFSLPFDKKIRTFSAGQQNQFEVIMALCLGADYILMDEPFVGNDIFNREDFYKVLTGILEENETVFLSTHLIEEVSGFVGRAILLKSGEVIGDVSIDELDERGICLCDYIKESYDYEYDRVGKAIDRLAEGEGTL